MLGKLAYRNAKRSLKDYLIYLITITISFSLILAFNLVASSDEVVKLSSGMSIFRQLLFFINIIIVFVVCFLINYTARFMFEKRSKEIGTYMLLGIKKKQIANLLVTENLLLGAFAFILAVPLGFLFSQFVSLVVVKLLGIPEVIFISPNIASIELLAIYFLVIYLLVLMNLLRRIRKMTVHDFLYLEKQNEKKMFHSLKRRNIVFLTSVVLGIASLIIWHLYFSIENISNIGTLDYLLISFCTLIISIYGISATCADIFLSLLLKSKKLKYQKDNLFVTRTFASKARTMSFTFGTLSMLILISILCLNFSSIAKGVYNATIELNAPYDVSIYAEEGDFDDFDEYLNVIKEDYTIDESFVYNVYKEMNPEIQKYNKIMFYDHDPVIKLSDYNRLLALRGMDTIELKEGEYFLVIHSQLLHMVENNQDIKTIRRSDGKKLKLKGIDTKSFWYTMCVTGGFVTVIPDDYAEGMEISERHLIVDTKEDTNAALSKKICQKMAHWLIKTNDSGEKHDEYYRVMVRGREIEEQNSMTAMLASICLYIAFILISAVGTILAVQSLSDSAKYKYRYLTLRRLGINDSSLQQTIRKQLSILFAVPAVTSIICSFLLLVSVNNVYQILLESKYTYLLYFAGSLGLFLLVYGVYWITAYIGFKRNINEEIRR